jgi:lysophospholipase L1-like esterase
MAIPPSPITSADIAATGYNPITQASVNAAVTAGVAFKDDVARRLASRTTNIQRLLIAADTARKRNPRVSGFLTGSEKPVVTELGATEPDIAFYSRLPFSGGSTVSNHLPYVYPIGGWVTASNNTLYVSAVTKTLNAATGQGPGTSYQGATRIDMNINTDRIIFGLTNPTITKWRLLIDGKYYDMAGFTPSASGLRYWMLDFTSLTDPYAIKRIEIEIQPSTSLEHTGFGRIYAPRNGNVWAVSSAELGPLAIVASDSFGTGANTQFVGDSFVRNFGDRAGLPNTISSSFSGSGLLIGGNSDGGPSLLDRINDIISMKPDVLIIPLGFNDMANDGNTVRAGLVNSTTASTRAALIATTVRSALPDIPIIFHGPWRTGSTTTRNKQQAWSDAIQAAIVALNDPLIIYRVLPNVFTGFGTAAPYQPANNSAGPYSGPLVFTAAISGVSGTLATPFSATTNTQYTIGFSDGSVRTGVTLTNGSTSVTWTGAVTATANAQYTHANAGNSDRMVSGGTDATHPPDAATHDFIAQVLLGEYSAALRAMALGM